MVKQPSNNPSPTVLRWELAGRLRALRTAAGKTVDEAARELMCSAAKISRLETGGRGIQARDVRDLCRYYAVPDSERDRLIQMAQDARRPGWWQDYRSLDEQTATFIGLETAASVAKILEARAIPGLLQTDSYTRHLLDGILVPAASADEIDDMTTIRRRRRQRLVNGEISFSVIMDEVTILRDFGRPDIMAEQVDRIIADSRLENVSIQIVPFNAAPYPGIEGSFQYLGFPDRAVTDLIFVEGLLGKFIIDREVDVARYLSAFEASTFEAFSPVETRDWLEEKRTHLRNALEEG